MLYKKQILIELKTNQLTLAIVQKKCLSGSTHIINVSKIDIDKNIFNNGIIYNPSLIKKHIQEFLYVQKSTNPQAIISIPELNQKQDLMLTLATFQAALCFSNSKLIITKIINTPLFDSALNQILPFDNSNLLDLLGNNKIKNPKLWLVSTFLCLTLSIKVIGNIRNKTKNSISTLKSKIEELKTKTNSINNQIKDLSTIKNQNNQIKISLKTLEKAKNIHKNPISHLLFISSKTPPNLYLTSIIFNKKDMLPIPNESLERNNPKNKKSINPKVNYIEIEGMSESIQTANHFIKTLSKNIHLFKKIEILYIKKIKNINKETSFKKYSKSNHLKYQFQASGQLNYSC